MVNKGIITHEVMVAKLFSTMTEIIFFAIAAPKCIRIQVPYQVYDLPFHVHAKSICHRDRKIFF